MGLRIIATGGTFDKHYNPITGELTFAHSHLPEAINYARLTAQVIFEQLPLLDSLDMRDADRTRILAACQASEQSSIVIVHGTDTMQETAHVIGAAGLDKTIVLTGAMIPYAISGSDAQFNLGFASGVAKALPHGTYIAMNGQIFNWNNVHKNRKAGVFESVR
jgi:L-asparaginase